MTRTLSIGVLAALVGILAGCASTGPTPEEQAREAARKETIEDILSKPLAADEYAEEQRCLSSYAYRNVDVIDEEHVVFRGNGDKLWINKLRQRCIGLRDNDILSFEMRGPRVCDLDTFEAISPSLYSIPGAKCSLGKFQPVTPEQVEAIELAVEESRKR